MADLSGYADLLAPPQQQAKAAPVNESAPDGYQDLFEQPAPAEPSRTGQTVEPAPGWGKVYKGFADRWALGSGALSKGAVGWKLALSETPIEDAQKEVETHSLLQAQQDTEDYANTHGYWQLSNIKISSADVAGGWLTEQLPTLGLATLGTIGGASLGAVAGIPIAGAVGGGALVFGTVMAGQTVYDLMQRKVDRNTARVGGLASGIVGGALGLLGAGAAGKGLTAASATMLGSQAFRKKAIMMAGHFAASMGVQVGAQMVGSLVDSTIKWISTRVSKGATPYEMQEALDDIGQATLQALVVAPQITGIAEGAGVAIGSRARAIQQQLDRKSREFAQKQRDTEIRESGLEAEAEANRQASQEDRTAVSTVKAKKQLRGYVEVKVVPELADAEHHLEQVSLRHDIMMRQGSKADKALAQLDLEHAQAELKEAQLAAKLEAVEDALTDPKTGDELRGKLEAQKARIQKRADTIYLHASELALKRKLATRERKLSEVRTELKAAKAAGKDTSNLSARYDQLGEQQALDEMLSEMFTQKLLSPGEVAFLRPQAPVKRLQGIVKVAHQQVENAAKAGAQEQRTVTTRVGTLLESVVAASRLPREDKTKLTAQVRKLQTFAQMQKELPLLQETLTELFDKRRKQAAHADLDRIVGNINPKKGVASRTPGTEEALVAIKEFTQDYDAVLRAEETLQNPELTPLDEMRGELAQLFPDEAKNLSAEQVEAIIDAVVDLKETGKTEALKRFGERRDRQERNAKNFWKAATIDPKGKRVSREAVSSALFKITSADPLKVTHRTWEGLMHLVTQRGTISPLREVFDLKAANSKAWEINMKWRERFKELVADEGVADKQYAKSFNLGDKRSADLEFGVSQIDETGQSYLESHRLEDPETGRNYTYWELAQLRNHMLDTDQNAVSRLKLGNGYTYPGEVPRGYSTLEVVESHLSKEAPDMLLIADAMRKLYAEFHGVVDDTVFRRWGRRLPFNPNYGGSLVGDSTLAGLTRESFRRMTLRPSSALGRQGGSQRVHIRNAFESLDGHITQFAREHSFAQFEQDAQALFNDQPVRDFIKRNYGKVTIDVIDKYIKDIVNGPREVENLVSKLVGFFRRKAFTYYLGARPEQYAKQMSGFIYALQHVSPREALDGYAYFAANPKKSIEMINKSPLLKARRQLLDPDYRPAKPGSIDNLSQMTMKAVEQGDIGAVYMSSFPVLLKVLRETGDEAKALAAFERAFEQSQGSSSIDELPHIYRSGAMVKTMAIFTQQPNRQAEVLSVSWDKFVNNPSRKTYGQYVNNVVVSYAGASLYPLAGWAIQAPFVGGEAADKKLKEILAVAPLGPYASIPFWGLVLAPLMVSGVNTVFDEKLGVHTPKSLDTDILNDFLKAGAALMKAGDGSSEHTWSAIMAAASLFGRVTGIPTTNILKLNPFGVPKK